MAMILQDVSFALCAIVGSCIGCSGEQPATSNSSVEASIDGEPGPICDGTEIFVAFCSGGVCHHSGAGAARGLDLFSPGVAERLVGVESSCNGRLYIDPLDVDRSFLLEKLRLDTPECGGSRMPLSGAPLSEETIQCIRDWIVTQLP